MYLKIKNYKKKDEIPPGACRPSKKLKKNYVEKVDPQQVETKHVEQVGPKKLKKNNVDKVGPKKLKKNNVEKVV